MDKDRDSKKQQLIFIVSVFLALIIIAWLVTMDWSLASEKSEDSGGSVQSMMSGLGESIENFNNNIADKKESVDGIVASLKEKFLNRQESIDNITESMVDKFDALQVETWSEHNDDYVYFKYPLTWDLTVNENVLILNVEGEQVLVITIYKSISDLPDNINNLDLIAWLDEQVDRELGVFTGYELSDLDSDFEMYNVMRKDSSDIINVYWGVDDSAYEIGYAFDEQYDKIIKLIISTIK
jgi:hypothetical protein